MRVKKSLINDVFRTEEDAHKPAYDRKHVCEEISIEVTNECRLRCAHCSSEAGNPFPKELSVAQINGLIDVGKKELGTKVVSLSGGEPLLKDGIEHIIKHVRNEGLQLLIYTCGNYFPRGSYRDLDGVRLAPAPRRIFDIFDVILDGATRANTSIIFSMEGLELAHDGLTGYRGSYENMLTRIKMFKAAGNVKVEVHFTPTKLNYKQMLDVYNVCNNLEIDRMSILRLVPQGRCQSHIEELLPDKQIFYEILVSINKLLAQVERQSRNKVCTQIRIGDPCDWRFFWDKRFARNCNAGINRILIRANGEAQFCAALKHAPDYDYGNVNDTPLKELWDDSAIAKRLRALHYGNIYVEPCISQCKYYRNCGGGCTSQRIASNKDMLVGPDPLCVKKYVEAERR